MDSKEIVKKIMKKKEFSRLPLNDVEKVVNYFNKKGLVDSDLVKFSRDLLRKMYTVFLSNKLLNLKEKDSTWFLNKHLSTKERLPFYKELYSKIIFPNDFVFDLGCGVNGFSYEFFPKGVKYFGFEAVGQLVDLQNNYFLKKGFSGDFVFGSLFDLDLVKKFLKPGHGRKVVFLFKVLDSLEMLEKNFSKKLLEVIIPLVDKVVISFATRSLISRKKFFADRKWLRKYLDENFFVLDEFELGSEKYLVLTGKLKKKD